MSRATGRMIGMGLGLLLLAIAPSQMSNAGEPSPALQQTETLTLTDARGWNPEAVLDTTQVEAPPANVEPEFGETLGQGWTALFPDPLQTLPDEKGVEHADCWINVGDTSVIACADGYTSIS